MTDRNEAAERLRSGDGRRHDAPVWSVSGGLSLFQEDVDDALAAERRATVERIRATVLLQRNRLGMPREAIRVTDLLAILDEEAAR